MSGAIRPRSGLDGHFQSAPRVRAALADPGCVWVTDADGTLWTDDIGEGFLKRLIEDRALVSPAARGDVWKEYEDRVRADRAAGYAWAAQVMAGMREADVEARARAYAAEFVPAHLYPAMKALLEHARAQGCESWIVSASNEWIIRAAAPILGIEPSRGLGIRVAVHNGLLTDEVVPPVTFKTGKVEAIHTRIGRIPSLVSGDSAGDVEMLEIATSAALFVRHAYTKSELLQSAQTNGWLVETFDHR